jgi:carboxyl-terminal processing protease
LPGKEQSEYTKALISNNIIFKYVNNYVTRYDSVAAPGEFNFTEYPDFKSFVATNGFDFDSELEEKLADLEKEVGTALSADFDLLKKKIIETQSDDIDEFQEEITKEIEMQIIARYYYQSGKAKQKLNGDSEIQEAIKLLNDPARYNEILGK